MTPPSLKHPGRWLWLFLLIPVGLGLWRLKFDVEVFDLLPAELPVVQGLKLYQEHFSNARELIITLSGRNAEQTEAAAKAVATELRRQPNLVQSANWQPPWLEHPEQSAELLAYLWFNQSPQDFRELAQRLAPTNLGPTLQASREQLATSMSPEEIAKLSYDPFGFMRLPQKSQAAMPSFSQGQQSFSSPDGLFRIVFVKANRELRTYRQCEEWLDAIQKHAAVILSSPELKGVEAGFTGRPAFVAEAATGMEHDITVSVGGTTGIIALLFWLAHRRIKPMLWLLTLLAATLGCTLALGGLIYGAINVISLGFAAILLGLAVDYAVVHYQEALAHPNLTIPQIRHAIAPSIFWAAITTITAFLVLNFGGLPGLGQLGTLVGLGVALAATIMIFEFLPPLFPSRNRMAPQAASEARIEAPRNARISRLRLLITLAVTAGLLATTAIILLRGFPRVDSTANALRPRHSPAFTAVAQIQARLSQKNEPLWLILGGNDVEEVSQKLQQSQEVLNQAQSNKVITSFTLPTFLWPRPEYQARNRATAAELASEKPELRRAALTNGFSEAALGLTERILNIWETLSKQSGTYWPTNPMSQWILEKLTSHSGSNYYALGMLTPETHAGAREPSNLSTLEAKLPQNQVWLTGWELLGAAVFQRVNANLWKVIVPMVVLVLLSLYLAFRRPAEIFLSLAVLALSGLCLLTWMRLAGWSWNLLNLMAIPLILGTGVDYSLFMQLALKRFGGDLGMAYRSVGRALLLCGGTAIAGFSSLIFSSNAGMASLGEVCAVGIAGNMLIAIFLLPIWWSYVASSRAGIGIQNESEERLYGPSSLYRGGLWRLGLWTVRVLPAPICARLAKIFVAVYWSAARQRREVVIDNLLPAVEGNRETAERKARELFDQFGLKLVDLWRYEAGLNIDNLFGQATGWERFEQARDQQRGVLLVAPHLGNWEFGSAFMNERGGALTVLTLAEPGQDFTALRKQSRSRRQIETLVIGDDPFSFLEAIRRLEAGAAIALLIDRPPARTAVTVTLFGKPFEASIAVAELARASGCAVLPVYVPRHGSVYDAHILPPIPYDRAALRNRAARIELTQRIMSAFEPVIREHIDQWFQFVPLWRNTSG